MAGDLWVGGSGCDGGTESVACEALRDRSALGFELTADGPQIIRQLGEEGVSVANTNGDVRTGIARHAFIKVFLTEVV